MVSSQIKRLLNRDELRKLFKKRKNHSLTYQQFKKEENDKIEEYNKTIMQQTGGSGVNDLHNK